MTKLINAKDAVKIIKDNMTVVTDGFLMTNTPELLLSELGKRFKNTHHPQNLELWFPCGIGDFNGHGIDHWAQKGMVKTAIGSYWLSAIKMRALIEKNQMEGYCLPQGIILQMFRDCATHKPITVSKIGVKTFIDYAGGSLNDISDIHKFVGHLKIGNDNYLSFKTPHPDVALLRGGIIDKNGNISYQNEKVFLASMVLAMATHNNGGKVIVQVEKKVNYELDPKQVLLPSVLVDYAVISSFLLPSLSSENETSITIPNSIKVASKQAIRLMTEKDKTLNIGIGKYPEGVAKLLKEKKFNFIPTVESGVFGGTAQKGALFGTAENAQAIINSDYMFDFYDGGGLDLAFLGLAETDQDGNSNVSKFNDKISGCGGFIDITQNTHKLIFIGSFTAGGLKEKFENGKLTILQEGKIHKFVNHVQQITFSGDLAKENKQEVYFVTERATFKLTPKGLKLLYYISGIDLKNDILKQMDFMPIVDRNTKQIKFE